MFAFEPKVIGTRGNDEFEYLNHLAILVELFGNFLNLKSFFDEIRHDDFSILT